MKTKLPGVMLLACCVALLFACAPQQRDTRMADEAAIRAADSAFSRSVETRQLDAAMACYADDAVALFGNAPMLTTKEAIRQAFVDMFAMADVAMKWRSTRVDVASSGDLGYTVGTYEVTSMEPSGESTTEYGKYTTVWKKQSDGAWKVVVDISNTD